MRMRVDNGLRRDGNLLGYVTKKNPSVFSDEFNTGIRSEWSKWVSSGNWQDYITTEDGKLKLNIPSGVSGGIFYPFPNGDFELSGRLYPMTGGCTTSSCLQVITRWDNSYNYFFPIIVFYDGTSVGARVEGYGTGVVYSTVFNYDYIDFRYVFQQGKSYVYWKPAGAQEQLVWSGNTLNVPASLYINAFGPGTQRIENIRLRELDDPVTDHFKIVRSYSATKYNSDLPLSWLDEPPLQSNYIRNRGYIYDSTYKTEQSGWAYANNCTWGDKDGREAMYFNGSNSVVMAYPYCFPSNMISTAFTISAWVWIDPATAQSSLILGKTTADTANYDYNLMVQRDLKGLSVDLNGATRFNVNNCIRFKEWQHVAATFDSTLASNNIKAYVNGELVGQTTYTTPIPSNGKPIFAGSRKGVAGSLNGWMRGVRLYNKALAQASIVEDMNQEIQVLDETYNAEYSPITGKEAPILRLQYY